MIYYIIIYKFFLLDLCQLSAKRLKMFGLYPDSSMDPDSGSWLEQTIRPRVRIHESSSLNQQMQSICICLCLFNIIYSKLTVECNFFLTGLY